MSSTAGPAGTGFNPYTGQLAVTVHDHGAAGQWNDGEWGTGRATRGRCADTVNISCRVVVDLLSSLSMLSSSLSLSSSPAVAVFYRCETIKVYK